MKKNHENHMALLFVIGAAALAVFFLVLAYMLLFHPEFILTMLRYSGAAVSAIMGFTFAIYVVKLIRYCLNMR